MGIGLDWKSIKTDLPTVDSPKSSMWIANRNSYIGVGNNSYAFDEWSYIG